MPPAPLDHHPNAPLLHWPGSRRALMTPALVLDLDALERNLSAMSRWAGQAGVRLRPHAKTHKCSRIAHRQVDLGAVGVCCATVRELEVMAAAGVPGLLYTAQLCGPGHAERLVACAKQTEVTAAVDHADALTWLDQAAARVGVEVGVVVDLDVGSKRTGVASVEGLLELARGVGRCSWLSFRGIQAYAAHAQHIVDRRLRRAAVTECAGRLRDAIVALERGGFDSAVVTGSGTGCFDLDQEHGLYTEYQVGSYAVMDVEYREVRAGVASVGSPAFEPAVFVAATVVGLTHAEADDVRTVLVNAGQKVLFRGGPAPVLVRPTGVGARYRFAGDEHGWLDTSPENPLERGELVELMAPHCDPTISLHDVFHVVQGEKLMGLWPVDARGGP